MLRGGWGPRTAGRLIWRGSVLVVLILHGVAELVVTQPRSREDRARWNQRFCGRILRWLGIPVAVEGSFPDVGTVVLNHETYLDITVLASLRPCVFVSKAEVGRWPVVGWMTKMAGTVFVERGKGGSAAAASVGMLAAARSGVPVVFFPEGTTSDGRGLLPFRGGLIAEARTAALPVTVGVIRYTVQGPRGATVEEDVAYWGDRGLLEHVGRFLTLEGVQVRVRFAEVSVHFLKTERKAAAAEAREAMLELGGGTLARETRSASVAGQGEAGSRG